MKFLTKLALIFSLVITSTYVEAAAYRAGPPLAELVRAIWSAHPNSVIGKNLGTAGKIALCTVAIGACALTDRPETARSLATIAGQTIATASKAVMRTTQQAAHVALQNPGYLALGCVESCVILDTVVGTKIVENTSKFITESSLNAGANVASGVSKAFMENSMLSVCKGHAFICTVPLIIAVTGFGLYKSGAANWIYKKTFKSTDEMESSDKLF